MKQTELIMGMPITVEMVGRVNETHIGAVFQYFKAVDARYSTYKSDSEITRINKGLPATKWSSEMKTVLQLCEQTKQQTRGYFDIAHNGIFDPSGLVKGWAIQAAAERLLEQGITDFYIEAGGDIQAQGNNNDGQPWRIGIRNPFNTQENIKILDITDKGIATSGTYIRGQHIYDPHNPRVDVTPVKSLTVIGPNIYEADRFATAAFAMGIQGIAFIENLEGFEGYMIDDARNATFTNGFQEYVAHV